MSSHRSAMFQVLWYQNSFLLQATDRRIMSSKGKTYTLAIKNVQFSDFGNYSCTVVNSIGRDRKYIELSGKPGPCEDRQPGVLQPALLRPAMGGAVRSAGHRGQNTLQTRNGD
jgi:hypothetical protein